MRIGRSMLPCNRLDNMGCLKDGRIREIYAPAIFLLLILAGAAIAAQVGPKSLYVALTISNNAPIVWGNNSNGTVTLVDGGSTEFSIKFNVTDADGTSNINDARVGINVTFNGVTRANNSGNCEPTDVDATTASYVCKVVFRYFDNSSSIWEINLSAADNNNAVVWNDSRNYGAASGTGAARNVTLSSLSAFTLQTPSVVSSASLGDTNKELSIVVNNTGNFDFTIINVTPFDLNASMTDFFKLEGNFSVNATASTGIGFGSSIANNTPRNFTASDDGLGGELSAALPHKITGGEANNLGNRTLYIYIDVPNNKGLSTGVTYNSSIAWELFTT